MKLIDRYILATVLVPLFYCLMAFLMLFIIFDLFNNLSDFIEAGTPLPLILKFYVFLLPSTVMFIAPISILLAVLYGLSQLTRSNELTAMRASGVSLYRLMVPILCIGVMASLIVAFINEGLAPRSAFWTWQFLESQKRGGSVDTEPVQELVYKNSTANRDWQIESFDTGSLLMRNITIFQERPDRSGGTEIVAATGNWQDGAWWFYDVVIQERDAKGYPVAAPQSRREMQMSDFTETPRDIINDTRNAMFLTSSELRGVISSRKAGGRETRTYEVDLHYRMAMPWTCLIVTLMGLPIGAHTGRKGAFQGIASAIGLFFLFYVLINIGMTIGKKGAMTPWMAVWLPNFIFLALGIFLIRRMR
jgi:lipopolysaccharide export system permease protein